MVQTPQAGFPLRVGLVAGEASGDTLGARLIEALREKVPGVQCAGIPGPKMAAAGCEAWHWAEELAVMGLVAGAYNNTGQTCISIERVFVEEPVNATDITRCGRDAIAQGPVTELLNDGD